MKIVLLAAAIAAATLAAPAQADPDAFVGELKLVPYDYCPTGWLEADGRLLPIRNYQVLFTLVGTRFGGDGISSFALPDMRKAVPLPNLRYCIAVMGDYPRRP